MKRLSTTLRQISRQAASFEGKVIDVTANGRATVQISLNGAVYQTLDVVGGPVEIGQNVHVDFTTPTPHVVAPGKNYSYLGETKGVKRAVHKSPANTAVITGTPTYWNPFQSDEGLGVYNTDNGYGSVITTENISGSAGYTMYDVTGAQIDWVDYGARLGYGNYLYTSTNTYFYNNENNFGYVRFDMLTGETKIKSMWNTNGNQTMALDNYGRVYMIEYRPQVDGFSLFRYNFDTDQREILYDFPKATNENGYHFSSPVGIVFVGHWIIAAIMAPVYNDEIAWVNWDVDSEGHTFGRKIMDTGVVMGGGSGIPICVEHKIVPMYMCAGVSMLQWNFLDSGEAYLAACVIDPAYNTCTDHSDYVQLPDPAHMVNYIGCASGTHAGYSNWLHNQGNSQLFKIDDDGVAYINYSSYGALSTCDGDVYHVIDFSNDTITWTRLSDLSGDTTLVVATGYYPTTSPVASDSGDLWVGAYLPSRDAAVHVYRHNLKTGDDVEVTGLPTLYDIAWITQIGDRAIICGYDPSENVKLIILPEI